MKCPKCDGTGKAEIGVGAFTIHGADCDQCNGKGIIEPMTNEEYIHSLNTEQLPKWLSNHNAFIYECGQKQNIPKVMYEEDLEWWLKQPHT